MRQSPKSSVGEALAEAGGYAPGFDVIRHVAAFMVLLSHAVPISSGSNAHEIVFRFSGGHATLGKIAVAVFFTLSGFLVMQSANRSSTWWHFLLKRISRVVPGLLCVVMISAFVLGPLVSTDSILGYYRNPATWDYMRLAVFLPADGDLPGVFRTNPYPSTVNGSLWTLRYEMACYILLTGVAFLYPFRHLPHVVSATLAAGTCLVLAVLANREALQFPTVVADLAPLASFFFMGAVLYSFRYQVVLDLRFAAGSLLVLLVSLGSASFNLLGPTAIAYIVVWIGLKVQSPVFLKRSDLSYGMYLYAFPVQQFIQLHWSPTWYINVLLSLGPTLALAYLSWTYVERPMLTRARRWLLQPQRLALTEA
ncbi:acyltransferase family protein [Geminicoccus harenae]|uniref:acyltransferase family protein n=1 Tax=Geminicoccus harenae TaxID=2498453 RepID=UPI00168B342B|nr:acyltransferase [Geminicoccus harenae]